MNSKQLKQLRNTVFNYKTKIYKVHFERCYLLVGYNQGKHLFTLWFVSKYTFDIICKATMSIGETDEVYSNGRNTVLIKDWGTNEGIYLELKSKNIISKKRETVKVGQNELYVCDLLINPYEYMNIEKYNEIVNENNKRVLRQAY